MALFNNTSFRLLEQGLDAVWLKQKVINQNIANSDTPGYKAKTVQFSSLLKEKCKYRQYHTDGNQELNLTTTITEEEGTNQLLDGNNVDVDKEMLDLADAQYQYDVLSGKITNEFSMIRTAISR